MQITPELFEKISRLQFEVFTYMNNNIRGQKQSTQRSGAPTKSITDRLRGKDGRIRGNLMGKRVDFSARSVITPDPVMDVDEVGIPYKVAMSMTLPVRVTSHNIEALTERVSNGPTHVFGAETVTTTNGVMINLAHCANRDKIRLQFGWVVERFLEDNDIVIFNRQPSLHKVGMMGHRVKLMDGNTFRLNLCCANPYNADFDGDEMNLHVPQSPAAIADVATIMMVSRQIISPQANRPVMAIVQDSLLGAHLFSSDDVLLDRMQACHVVAHLRYARHELPPPCVVAPEELWSGKQLIALLFPRGFQYGSQPASKDLMDHKHVVVRNGLFVTGVLKKATMGTSSGGFVDVLYRQYGCMTTVRWMSDVQRLVNAWLCTRGFAVGVKDCVLGAKGEARVRERIYTTMSVAKELIDEEVAPGTNEAQVLEGTVVRILSKCLMHTGGIVDEELGAHNAIRKMVQAGSKGNPINLSQICGCVGQQSVEGRRVFAEKGGRTLSCFSKQDRSLQGQGFVQNSYALGLHPHEYFFHAMGGREGLVDTAVKTATTGYIQRRQMKSMEDHKVCYDGSVRNADEAIIDFSYGGDGMDPTRVERVVMPMLKEAEGQLDARLTPWEAEHAVRCRRQLVRCKQPPFDARILLPFSPSHLYDTRTTTDASVANWNEIEERVRKAVLAAPSLSIRSAILDFFNTRALVDKGYTSTTTDALFAKVESLTANAHVNAGEMVGSIAAQSIGEPCTQVRRQTTAPLPRFLRPLLVSSSCRVSVPTDERFVCDASPSRNRWQNTVYVDWGAHRRIPATYSLRRPTRRRVRLQSQVSRRFADGAGGMGQRHARVAPSCQWRHDHRDDRAWAHAQDDGVPLLSRAPQEPHRAAHGFGSGPWRLPADCQRSAQQRRSGASGAHPVDPSDGTLRRCSPVRGHDPQSVHSLRPHGVDPTRRRAARGAHRIAVCRRSGLAANATRSRSRRGSRRMDGRALWRHALAPDAARMDPRRARRVRGRLAGGLL